MRIRAFFRYIYKKLVKINDSPAKISFGMSIGVFFGVIPFAGPVIAFFAAGLLKANKLSALIGCLLTNTWITFFCAIWSVKIGADLFHLNEAGILKDFSYAVDHFSIPAFLKIISGNLFVPFMIAFILVALLFSIVSYILTWAIIYVYRHFKKPVNTVL